jgi:hypothetical protein
LRRILILMRSSESGRIFIYMRPSEPGRTVLTRSLILLWPIESGRTVLKEDLSPVEANRVRYDSVKRGS